MENKRKVAGDKIKACPRCNSTMIYRRKKVRNWICRSCGHVFQRPRNRRPLRRNY